jgi:hypothetical protein
MSISGRCFSGTFPTVDQHQAVEIVGSATPRHGDAPGEASGQIKRRSRGRAGLHQSEVWYRYRHLIVPAAAPRVVQPGYCN